MPFYSYKCNNCEHDEDKSMKISEYLSLKTQKMKCPECKDGVLLQQLAAIRNVVERTKEELICQAEEDARKIVEKIKAGDERTIRDIYGEKRNQLKFGKSK